MSLLAARSIAVSVICLMLLTTIAPALPAEDRGPSDLVVEGYVLTGDGTQGVRGATVLLTIYNHSGGSHGAGIGFTDDAGEFNISIHSWEWEVGYNASLEAMYTPVAAAGKTYFTLTSAARQAHNVTINWNRTLGADVSVADPMRTTGRDGQATFVVNVTNAGNDTDAILLEADPENNSVLTDFTPRDRIELAPAKSALVSLMVSGPGLPPGDYAVALRWSSEWFAGETGTVQLTWRVTPEIELSVPYTGISWEPDPLFAGDDAQLDCVVVNAGRDEALKANVTMELVHPVDGLVLRDRVRLDVPGKGSAPASFPWKAVFSEQAYTLSFEVEHPRDPDPRNDRAEVQLEVGVSNVPPSVAFASPENGTHVNGTVDIRLGVTDPDTPVTDVFLRIGGGEWVRLSGGPSTYVYAWDTTTMADGWYVLEAYAKDRYSAGATARLELKVENMGPNHVPEVFIEVPQDGDTVGTTLVTRGITFDEDDHVELVELRVDGGDWTMAQGATRWSANLSTAGLTPGPHMLEVRAFDGIDNSPVADVVFHTTDQPIEAMGMALEVTPPTVLPSEGVRVAGELVYDNGVRAAGLQVRIEGPGGLLVFRTTDERGAFEVSTKAPSTEGLYEYKASATDGEGRTASNATKLRVLRSLDPDLTVSAIRVESGQAAMGTNVTLSVDVSNLGYRAGNGTLRVWEGGIGQGDPLEVRDVTVYDVLTASFTWVPGSEGDIELWAEVTDVQPGDANASNNRRSQVVVVVNLPDLVVEGIVLSNPTPHDNDTVTVTVRVRNLGGLNASCTVMLYLDGTDVEDLVGDDDLGVLAKGFAHATFEVKAQQGPHRLTARIVNAYPDESNADNNEGTRKFNVTGPFVPPKGEEERKFPGMGAVAGTAALLASAALIAAARGRRN